MTKFLYKYCLSNYQKYINDRLYFNLNLEYDIDNIEDIINYTEKLIDKKLSEYKRKYIVREVGKDFNMKWHIDDCIPFYNKNNINKDNLYNVTILTDNLYLYHKNKLPIYTMIIYLSNDSEYKGGEFCFIDKQIKPKKYDVLFFNSKEIHKVNMITNGIRKNIIIKYYNNI